MKVTENSSSHLLSSLIEHLPLMVFVKDAKTLHFVQFNKAGEQLLEMSREELIGKSDYDFFPRDQADFFSSKDQAVLHGRSVVDIPEEPIMTKRGLRVLHTRKIPLLDAEGLPQYLLGISEDITDKLKVEAERVRLAGEQAGFHAMLMQRENTSRSNLFLKNASMILASSLDRNLTLKKVAELVVPFLADWCCVEVLNDNQSFERVAAVHRDPDKKALTEELVADFSRQEDRAGYFKDILKTGRSQWISDLSDERLGYLTSGPRHHEIVRQLDTRACLLVPMNTSKALYGVMALYFGGSTLSFSEELRSIAEELGTRAGIAIENALLYERTQKAVEARDEFLSIASHELKTPVTSLKLQLQMILRNVLPGSCRPPTPEKLVSVLTSSIQQVDRLTRLVDDLLDVSRIRSGKVSYTFQETDLSHWVKEVVERHFESLSDDIIMPELTIEEGIHARIDRDRIEQVLLNLISNVLKYAPGKPFKIHVRKMAKDHIDGLQIAVSDSGPGIALSEQTRVFERFERAVTSKNVSGLGLGLFISKQIVEGHQGKLFLESELNKGSTFTVEIPTQPYCRDQ